MAVINGTSGNDSLVGSAADDVIDGLGGNDTVLGLGASDTLKGGEGDDSLYGGDGGDDLHGGAGNDLLDGGTNPVDQPDVAFYTSAAGPITANLGTGLVTGEGTDTLVGIEAVLGSAFNDTFIGSAGDDAFGGMAGNDSISGGAGFDTVYYGDATGAVTVNLSLASAQATGADGTDTLSGIEAVIGSAFNDTLAGNAGDNHLSGRGGNDSLTGGDGNDSLDGGDGNDSLFGDVGNDSLLGGAGNDFLVGGSGNDTLVGGAILDRINYTDLNSTSYLSATTGVNVNLATGVALDGLGGTDSLQDINFATGSGFNDTLTGSSTFNLFEQFEGAAGNDTIDGGAIDVITGNNGNRASYAAAPAAVNVNLTTGVAQDGYGTTDSLVNINQVRGSAFADTLTGSDATAYTEFFEGRAGNDTIDGKGGNDQVRYDPATSAVNVNLVTGIAQDGQGGTDSLLNIEGIRGSNFNDTLTGGNAANGTGTTDGFEFFQGNAGSDTIDGGGGYDRVDYTSSTAGANVTLGGTSNGTAQDGLGGVDTLINIEAVRGSDFNDTLTGSDSGVFESFEGRAGNDTIDGKGGVDRADYSGDWAAVNVNLSTGIALDGFGGTDTLLNIEQVRGSAFNDSITGDSADNGLFGRDGHDTLRGGAGNDSLSGDAGDDWHFGGAGNDTINGGAGYDRVSYQDAAGGVVVNMATGAVSNDGDGGQDSLVGIERVIGSAFNDSIVGSGADDDFSGNAGNDTLDGGSGGFDFVWYGNAPAAVQVDLQAGTATGGEGNDTLISIEGIAGSNFADTLLGSTGNNYFRGGGGADSIDGRGGFDTIDYRDDAAGVTINLATGSAVDGTGATDTLVSFEEARGSHFNDSITGSTNLYFERFEGQGGNDTIDGGTITDTLNQDNGNQASYQRAGAAVTVNLATGTASGGAGNDVLININEVRGSAFNDTLIGSQRADNVTELFEGGAGDDSINGGGGFDIVRFDGATGGVTASLATGSATGAGIGTDTFTNVEGLYGSSFNDSLVGGLAANGTIWTDGLTEIFRGGAGNDTIDGGQGYDRADYTNATTGVVVTLNDTADGSASDGLGGTDVLRNIEGVRGSVFNDTLTGSSTAAFESFEGREGNDSINGNGGIDRADYLRSKAGVSVDLSANTASNDGYGGVDTLLNIEWVRGSRDFNDTIVGSVADNRLEGMGGNDSLAGLGGNDSLFGGDGDDSLIGNDGNDSLDGGAGNDTLDGGTDNDSLLGGDGADSLLGGDGNDFIMGGSGADTMAGGSGDDYYIVWNSGDSSNDHVNDSGGYDVVSYNFDGAVAPVSFTLTVASGTQTDPGGGVDTFVGIEESQVHGGNSGDTFVGDSARNWLQGNGGNDTLTGGGGNDTFGYRLDAGGPFPIGIDLITDAQVGDNLSFSKSGGFSLGSTILSGDDASMLTSGQIMVGTPSGGVTNLYIGTDSTPGKDIITIQLQGTFSASSLSVRNDSFGGWLDIVSTGAGSATAGPDTLTGTTGPDSIDGLGGNDSISGLDGNDTLIGGDGHDTLRGGAGNDSLSGDAGDDWHFGGAGNDTINGGAGYDRVSYQDAAGGVVVNMATGAVSNDGDGGQDSLVGIERVIGSAFNDSIVGSGADDDFSGNAGNDTLDGGSGGFDFVWYGNAPAAVQVDLQAGTATGGEGNDTLISIEGIAGSNFADTLLGSTGNNYFRGGGGADSIDGRGGFDTIDYRDDAAGVTINLATGSAVDGTGATDTLVSFEEARGSHFNDSITGSTNLYFERFEGQGGNDTIDGGTITDTLNQDNGNQASYQRAGAAVTVNLATGTASGGAGNDVLININEVRGSAFNDTLIGSQRADNVTELFEGGAGDDSINGGGGFDIVRFDGATGGVTASLATGSATGAGIGTDTFTNVEGLFGSSFNDSLVGGLAANGTIWTDGLTEIFRGGAGNDTIDGGQGYDRADYTNATTGVVVTLNDTADGSASDGLGGTDVLRNIEGVRGSVFNDTLTGSSTAAFESFEGREGNDSINGNGGIDRADYLRSKAGVSVDLSANTASNDGYGGVDTLLNIEWVRGSRDFNDTIVGSVADNRLEGMGGNDSISGLGGNDTLLGGAGNDTLIGGDGFDTADYSGAGTPVSVILYGNQVFGVDSGNDSVAGIEHIIGTAGADLMYGDDGANRFEGGLGEDTLDGGGGEDTLIGGEGADLLNGLAGADSLDGGNGNDSLYGWADNDSLIGAEGDDRLYGGAGADSLDGGTGADQLEGDDGNDTLVGGVGADTLRGWNDNDSLDGGDDGDALFGGAGADTLLGAGGDDQIEGDDGNDSLAGGTGADTLRGWNDNDTLDGGEGNDALYGGAGLDSMLGGLGNDVLEGDDGADTLAGGDGADTLRGWNDNDNLDGGEGNDLLVGWSGNDSMSGGAGDDQLFGDDGADTLDGGAGGDVLQGGLGNDLYRFAADFGFDGVRDYDYIAGNNDTFHFSSHNIGDLSFARVGDALKVTHTANSANTLYVNDWYQAGSAGAFKIETWTMANGSSFTAAQIEALVTP
jgi:Ca2+-binding RTX toxin-like protein